MIPSSSHPSSRLSRKARDWVALLASGECSQQDITRLRAWLARKPEHRSAFDRQRSLWNALGGARELVLSARPDLLDAPAPARGRRPWWRLAAWQGGGLGMAVLAACVIAPPVWIALQADVRTGSQPREIALEDGSRVMVDAASAIAVDYSPTHRRVTLLQGRAWFQVVHQARPFQVDAGSARVVDVGTAFAMERSAGGVLTEVAEGEVDLSATAAGSTPLRMRAGDAALVRANGLVQHLEAQPPENAGAWRRGEILITGLDAEAAIARIAPYHAGPVWTLGNLGDEQVTAVFHTQQPDQAINAVAQQLGLTVRRLPGNALLVHR